MSHESTTPDWRPSRRTVVKGAAWAAPVIAVASAAPAFATSHEPIVPTYSGGSFCKHTNPGSGADYHAVFCFNNTTEDTITVDLGTFTVPSGESDLQGRFSVDGSFATSRDIGPGCHCYYVDSTTSSTAANGMATLRFSYVHGGTTYSGQVSTEENNNIGTCGSSVPTQPHDGRDAHPQDGPTTSTC